MAFGVEEYNNDTQMAKLKAAFQSDFKQTWNAPIQLSFTDGVSAEKRKTFADSGTPSGVAGTPWNLRRPK